MINEQEYKKICEKIKLMNEEMSSLKEQRDDYLKEINNKKIHELYEKRKEKYEGKYFSFIKSNMIPIGYKDIDSFKILKICEPEGYFNGYAECVLIKSSKNEETCAVEYLYVHIFDSVEQRMMGSEFDDSLRVIDLCNEISESEFFTKYESCKSKIDYMLGINTIVMINNSNNEGVKK